MINTLNTKQDSLLDLPPRFSGAPDTAALNKKIPVELREEAHAIMQKTPQVQNPFEEEINQIDKPIKVDDSKDNYIEAFINNKMVRDVFPGLMIWVNVLGNTSSLLASLMNFNEHSKKLAQTLGSLSTRAFFLSTAVINVIERIYSRNYLSAMGYFNDILIAGLVGQDNAYLARGTASGTYNMANSLSKSVDKDNFVSFEDHLTHTIKAFKKFFGNLLSPNVFQNFLNHKNGMWAIFGGIFSNVGALSWMLSGKVKMPTLVRDIAGVMMDIEQLNPGHLKEGRSSYFYSGVFLALGTVCDWVTKFFSNSKDIFVPLTFILDGVGRHLLRLDQNERELKGVKKTAPVIIRPIEAPLDQSRLAMQNLAGVAA